MTRNSLNAIEYILPMTVDDNCKTSVPNQQVVLNYAKFIFVTFLELHNVPTALSFPFVGYTVEHLIIFQHSLSLIYFLILKIQASD